MGMGVVHLHDQQIGIRCVEVLQKTEQTYEDIDKSFSPVCLEKDGRGSMSDASEIPTQMLRVR